MQFIKMCPIYYHLNLIATKIATVATSHIFDHLPFERRYNLYISGFYYSARRIQKKKNEEPHPIEDIYRARNKLFKTRSVHI